MSAHEFALQPKPNFSDFVFDFTCNAFVFDPFSYIYGFKSLFHMFVFLFALHMLELGFILFFPCFDAIGAKLLQGK